MRLILCILIVLLPHKLYAIQESQPLALDSRIRTYMYVPNEVYIFTGFYSYQSTIIFGNDETIQSVLAGDSMGWMIQSNGNRMFLKPVEPEAMTNMTVITDKRIYLFELHAEEAEDIRDEGMAFVTRFEHPNIGSDNHAFREFPAPKRDVAPKLLDNPERYDFNYTVTGSQDVTPQKIFDDGQFTYLEFDNQNAPIPAIFKVDAQGNESLINYRITDSYVVIEEVTNMMTLRYGSEVACIFNESRPLERKDLKEKFLWFF